MSVGEFCDPDGDPLPDALTLRPRRLKWLAVFLISLGFIAIAAWLGPDEDKLLFWGAGGFFVVCGLIAVPQMLGFKASLEMDQGGFTCRTMFWSFRREWRECSPFVVVTTPLRQGVGFSTLGDEQAHPTLAASNRALIGASGMLPETYSLSALELAQLMNAFRERALASD